MCWITCLNTSPYVKHHLVKCWISACDSVDMAFFQWIGVMYCNKWLRESLSEPTDYYGFMGKCFSWIENSGLSNQRRYHRSFQGVFYKGNLISDLNSNKTPWWSGMCSANMIWYDPSASHKESRHVKLLESHCTPTHTNKCFLGADVIMIKSTRDRKIPNTLASGYHANQLQWLWFTCCSHVDR